MSDLYTVTVEEFRAFVKTPKEDSNTVAMLELSLGQAIEEVDRFCGSRIIRVPENTYRFAVLQVAQELYYRNTKQPNQQQMMPNGEFMPSRPTQDPLLGVYSSLRKWIGWF